MLDLYGAAVLTLLDRGVWGVVGVTVLILLGAAVWDRG
jgi:hypothetical protein